MMFGRSCSAIPYEKQLLNEQFEIVKEDYYKENGGVIFPNPNAPTGALLPLSAIEDVVKHNPDSSRDRG